MKGFRSTTVVSPIARTAAVRWPVSGPLLAAALLLCGASASAEPYRHDPAFNSGAPRVDRFAGSSGADYRGRFVAAVPAGDGAFPGDVIVAGLVPQFQSGNATDGTFNIGLVRYGRDGTRRTWHDPVQWGFFNDQYVIVPNGTSTSGGGIRDIVAMTAVHGRSFYVLANYYFTVYNRHVSYLYRFTTTGRWDRILVLNDDNPDDGTHEDSFAIDMALDPTGDGAIYIMARREYSGNVLTDCEPGYGCPIMARVALNAAGYPALDSGFGVRRLGPQTPRRFRPTSVDIGLRGSLSPYLYVAGTEIGATTATRRILLRRYNDAAGYLNERAVSFRGAPDGSELDPRVLVGPGSAGSQHEVFVAGRTVQRCRDGTGVAKFGDNLNAVSGFGTNGKILFGGSDSAPESQSCAFARGTLPQRMALAEGRLAIVGQMDEFIDQNITRPAGMLAVVDAADGSLIDFRGHFVEGASGVPIGVGYFYGVAATGAGSFTAVGDQRDAAAGNRLMFNTARLAGATLFRDGFE